MNPPSGEGSLRAPSFLRRSHMLLGHPVRKNRSGNEADLGNARASAECRIEVAGGRSITFRVVGDLGGAQQSGYGHRDGVDRSCFLQVGSARYQIWAVSLGVTPSITNAAVTSIALRNRATRCPSGAESTLVHQRPPVSSAGVVDVPE